LFILIDFFDEIDGFFDKDYLCFFAVCFLLDHHTRYDRTTIVARLHLRTTVLPTASLDVLVQIRPYSLGFKFYTVSLVFIIPL